MRTRGALAAAGWLAATFGMGAAPFGEAPAPVPRGTEPPPLFEDLARRAAEARGGGRLPEAIARYREALSLRPAWDEGWWYLGTVLYELDRHGEAREAFAEVTARKPELGPAWTMRGLCDYRLAAYEDAERHLEEGFARGLAGNEAILKVARFHRAALLVRQAEFDVAMGELTLLVRMMDGSGPLYDLAGLVLLRLAHLPHEVPEDRRDLVAAAGRAGYWSLTRNNPEAEKAFAALIARWGDEPQVHYSYGVYLLREEPDRALQEFRRELLRDPGHVYSHLQIAFEHLKRLDYAGARAPAEEAVRLAPRLFASHNALGRALVGLGETEKGVASLEEAAQLAPDSPEVFFHLAQGYQRAGRPEDALGARTTFSRLDKARQARRRANLLGRPPPDLPGEAPGGADPEEEPR